MTTEREVLTEIYSYKRFNFIIKVILKEQSLEIDALEGEDVITSAKIYFNPVIATNNRLGCILLNNQDKSIMSDVKESLRFYADYGTRYTRKAIIRKR